MKRWLLIFGVCTFSALQLRAEECESPETFLIDAESQCVEGGIDIGFLGTAGAKVACLESRRVQGICGPDGRLTRLRAYGIWFNKLKKFEADCANRGGIFAYQDPNFAEPHDENFCLPAQPEVGANMFEEPLCNFRSICPTVAVTCDFPCHGTEVRNEPVGSPYVAFRPLLVN